MCTCNSMFYEELTSITIRFTSTAHWHSQEFCLWDGTHIFLRNLSKSVYGTLGPLALLFNKNPASAQGEISAA